MRRLTSKQQAFITEYLQNGGNGTQAAMKAYPTATYQTARAIAAENLTKPNITFAIEKALGTAGLGVSDALRVLKEALGAENFKGLPDWSARLKATDMLLRLTDVYPRPENNFQSGSRIDPKVVEELKKEPVEVLRWAHEHGRLPDKEERLRLTGESPAVQPEEPVCPKSSAHDLEAFIKNPQPSTWDS